MGEKRNLRRGLAACIPVALLALSAGANTGVASTTPTTQATTDRVAATQRHATSVGSVNLRQLSAQASTTPGAPNATVRSRIDRVRGIPTAQVPVPNPDLAAVADTRGGAHGFVGITDATMSQVQGNVSVEPPDQGLCAHAGVVLEAVNLGLQVYTEAGQSLTRVVSLNAFFHLPGIVNGRNPTTFGPFLSDPRCYFDAQTSRWFVSVLEIDVNPYTGALGYRSATLLAVSRTSDPTGSYGLFSIDSTNDGTDGTPAEANCPCFGDQPRLGADANGIYITTDNYPIHGVFNSNGGELYALSKSGLATAAAGGATPTLVDIHTGEVIVGGHPSNALQPATTPEGAGYATNTEYFLNTPDFNGFATMGGAGAKAVVLWALRGTSSLATAAPSLRLSHAILPSEPYAPPVAATQKKGPIPYGNSIGATVVPPLSVNDDRMQQVEYVNGKVYSSLNTGIGATQSANRSGIAWFVVTPTTTGGSVTSQGYVAIGSGASLLYPAIGLDAAGEGVMTFSLSGPGYFPSAAFMRFAGTSPAGPIYITGRGTAPEDGFTCYSQAGFGPACRWGDYSAASSDGAGHIVMADEMIPNTARGIDANWGTFVSVVSAH